MTIFLIGLLIIESFSLFKEKVFLEKLGYAYGLGMGMITIQMFLYSLFGIHWSGISILVPWLLFYLFFFLFKKSKKINYHLPNFPNNYIDRTILILIIATSGFVLFESLVRPVSGWDAWVSWFMGGKAFYVDGHIKPEFIKYVDYDYPPLINLMITFPSIMLGKFNDQLTLLLFTFFYFSLLIIFYYTAKKYTSQRLALLFTFMLAVTQNFIRQAGRYDVGYADLPLSYYFFLVMSLILQVNKKISNKDLIIINLFLGVGALIKNEGLTFLLIIQGYLIVNIIKVKKYKKFVYLLIGLIILFIWEIFKYENNLPGSYLTRGVFNISRMPVILQEVLKEMFNLQRWNLIWPAYFISILISRFTRTTFLLIIMPMLQLSIYLFVYFITPLDLILHIRSSFDRLLIHIAPMIILFICIAFNNLLTREKQINP